MVELFTPAAVCGCVRAVRKTSGFERQVLRVLRRTIYASRHIAGKAGEDACHGPHYRDEPGRSPRSSYLRAAQAYMLISMPTGTSTIFGVFQVISLSQALASKWLAR